MSTTTVEQTIAQNVKQHAEHHSEHCTHHEHSSHDHSAHSHAHHHDAEPVPVTHQHTVEEAPVTESAADTRDDVLDQDSVEVTDEVDDEDSVENLDQPKDKKAATPATAAPAAAETKDPLGPLRAAIGHEVDILNQKMVAKLGVPKDKGEVPTLKVLCDAFIFYNENRREVKDPKDILNINMAMLIGDRMERILDTANVLYTLSERKFLEIVHQYVETKKIVELPLNSQEVVAKRAKIIEGMKIAKETALAQSREKMRAQAQAKALADAQAKVQTEDQIRESPPGSKLRMWTGQGGQGKSQAVVPAQAQTVEQPQPVRRVNVPEKKCCAVCQLADGPKLVKIVNSPETTNKMICLGCMSKQKTEHQIRFTQIKNGKVYLKDLPKSNTR